MLNRLCIGVLVAVLLLAGWQQFRISFLRAELSTAQRDVALKQAEVAGLEKEIDKQNAHIQELKKTAVAIAHLAGARVETVIAESAVELVQINQAGAGPEEMNQWFASQF